MTEHPKQKSGEVIALCPVAAIWSCSKCPVYRVCPGTTIIGDVPIETQAGKSSRTPKK